MSVRREQREMGRTKAERARLDAIRAKYQRAKPGPDQLAASGQYEGPVLAGAYWEVRRIMAELKAERERQELTLAQLAERAGIDKGAISKLETGRQVNPTVDTLSRIAAGLGVTVGLRLQPAGRAGGQQGAQDESPGTVPWSQTAGETSRKLISVDYISHFACGPTGWVTVPEGTTVRQFLRERKDDCSSTSLVLVNLQKVPLDYILQHRDSLSVTPTGMGAAWLPQLREFRNFLKSKGFHFLKPGKGDHEIWADDVGRKLSVNALSSNRNEVDKKCLEKLARLIEVNYRTVVDEILAFLERK
jgi:transcriptional regulator with XRE-family HTH domain